MLTEDENIVDIQFAVQYRLKDARADYLFNNRKPDDAVHAGRRDRRCARSSARARWTSVLYEGARRDRDRRAKR